MQNTEENYVIKLPDHKVFLTEKGKKQADDVGKFLCAYLTENSIPTANARMWVSPYLRTRQTAEILNGHLTVKDKKEDVSLIEQQYGLFSDNPMEERKRLFPSEFEYHKKHFETAGKFYAKMPLGESPLDVAMRIRHFLPTIFRDYEKGKKDTLFIVTHGVVIKTFILDWFHLSPEWFSEEGTPENCSVIEIVREDNGKSAYRYIYGKARESERK
jgi:broad specificity phosphatase PhoE